MLQTKALYNLLRLNAANDPSVRAEPWALENLRVLPLKELFSRLKAMGAKLDKETFLEFAANCDTPEELTEILSPDEDSEQDAFYLIVFELWRRLVPEKQSLSIFCDELDSRISLYDQEEMENDEPIQDALANLLEVLEENSDTGSAPVEVFVAISNYCANDIESFLYDYITDLLDHGSSTYASELIEGFTPYMTEPLWFDFLRARLLAFSDVDEANLIIQRLLQAELEIALLFEILQFIASSGEKKLFLQGVKKVLPLLKTQDELLEILAIVAEYYRLLDEDALEEAVQRRIDRRKKRTGKLDSEDEDLKFLKENLGLNRGS